MTRLERLILKKREEIRELNRKKRARALRSKAIAKIPKKRGRKPIDKELIQKAELLAYEKPIDEVALSLGVSRTTLYKHGIKRYILDRKTAA